ncbi:hypothetical protein PT974_00600 [Cladobotryum mycophilum]|uniref:Uncharacterized protein n=1 Tax=Cladobotryum mycophilum TaxID=491253 RepID=A0ABR0T1I7_9HYPO
MDQQASNKRQSRGKESRPRIDRVLSFDLSDRRILNFWLLEIYCVFIVCLVVVSFDRFTKLPTAAAAAATTAPTPRSNKNIVHQHLIGLPLFPHPGDTSIISSLTKTFLHHSLSSDNATNNVFAGLKGSAALLSMDVWFAVALMANIDALIVVMNFNRRLITRFHYAVTLRMMMLASIFSFGVLLWNLEGANFVSKHPVTSAVMALGGYLLFGRTLDRFETPIPTTTSHDGSVSGFARGSLQQYGEVLSLYDLPWPRVVFSSVVMVGAGFLTLTVPPPWSILAPIFLIFFEFVVFAAFKIGRTPRYVILSFPFLQGVFCIHWGLIPVRSTAMELSMPPWIFLVLCMAGRWLFDLHMWTVLRSRRELQWARRQILPSTRKIMYICAAAFLLEMMGIKVITYVKPITLYLAFLISSAAYPAPISYAIAFVKTKTIRN